MELGAKDFFMVISLLKLLQIYCTKHIIVVLDSKAKNFFFAHKSTFIQQMLESQYNSDIFLITVKSRVLTHLTRLEAHAGFFKLLMNGTFDPYILLLFEKKLIS